MLESLPTSFCVSPNSSQIVLLPTESRRLKSMAVSSLKVVIVLICLWPSSALFAQLTGPKTIPGNYATVALAVADLNAVGVGAGGVTFNVAAGHTEITDIPVIAATGTMANPIVFQKSGVGLNPSIQPLTAGTIASSTTLGSHGDGIIVINGGDYITFDGIDLMTDATFTTTGMYEFGYYLKKASGTDACKNIIIRNCTIELNKAAIYSFGVFVSNISGVATVTVTSTGGRSENIYIYSNVISNAYGGVQVRGFLAASPYDLYDQNIWVGEDGGNTISDYGGGGSTAYGIYAIYQNDLKINRNNISGGDNTTTTHYGIFISTSINGNIEIDNNTISLTNNSTTSQVSGIGLSAGATTGTTNTQSVTNNTITGFSRPAATTGATYFIYSTSNYPQNLDISENIIGSSTLPGTGTTYGIYQLSNPVNITITDNVISDITRAGTTSTSAFYGINCDNSTATTQTTVSGNVIHSLIGSGSTGVVGGITVGTQATLNVYQNKIYNISSDNASGVVYGMTLASGVVTYNVYNNLIGDLRTPSSGQAADAIRGINITSTTASSNINVSYNTVLLNATSTGTNFSSTGIYHTTNATATSGTLNLRNNIIVNLSTPTGTGLAIAYRRSSTTLTNFGSVSDRNLFYAGTPDASHVIFYDGTNSDQMLSGYKTRVTPREASSVTENPMFLSTMGASANFLHINTASATQIESGGIAIVGINDDFDGAIRQGSGGYGGTGTAPDIGADEFEGIAADLIGPAIAYTLFGNTACTMDLTLSATISDASGVNVAGGTKPRLYFKKSTDMNTYAGNTSADNGWKYVEATNASSPFSFTTNYSLLQSAVAVTDIIQYFVVAQDLAGIPNVGINSGIFNTPATSVALVAGNFPLTGTINIFTIIPSGLGGTVTIGAAGTYPTLTGAGGLFEAINASGLSGNLTVNILDASITETGATALNSIIYTSCTPGPYSVHLKPGAGVTSTLTGSSTPALIKLNGADYITIDGSNNGSSSRNLSIENTATGTNSAVIWIASLGTGAGAANNTVKNTNIKAGSKTVTSAFGIHVGGTTISTTGTGDDNDNLTIQNNSINKAYYGIYARATASGVNNGLNINNNSIGSENVDDHIGFRGIQIYQADGATITENTIFNIVATATNLRAMELVTGFVNSTVSKNTIYEINYTATTNSAGKGITINSGSATSNVTISNNVIYGLKGHGSTTATNNSWGIMLEGGGGYNIYYNSVNLSDDRTSTSSTDIHGAMYVASTVTAIDLRNNVLVSTAAAGNAAGKTYALYSLAANTAFTNINYNDYWATGTNRFAGFISSTDRTTLAEMQAGFGQNVNALVADPLFNSNTNLQPQLGSPADGAGTPIAGITTDITGFVRDVTNPTMGAYEQATDVASPVITYAPLFFTCTTGNRNLNGVTIVDASGVPVAGTLQPRIYYKKNLMGSWFSSQGTLSAGSSTNGTWDFTIVASDMGGLMSGDVVYYFVIAQDIASPANIISNPAAGLVATNVNTVTTPPTTPNTYAISTTLNGTYTVGSGGAYTTLTSAVAAYNSSCLGGSVVFSLTNANYAAETFPIIITLNPDASATKTLTIKATQASTTISGTSASALIVLNGADYVTIDGSVGNAPNTVCPLSAASRNLTFSNSSTSTTSAVIWLQSNGADGATNNKVINCNLTGNSATTTLFGIGSGSSTISTASLGTNNDNNSFVNNNITKTQYGILSRGASAADKNTGTVINQNIMSGTAPDNIGRSGIWTGFEDGIQISGNRIENITNTADLFAITLGISNSFGNTTTAGSDVTNASVTHNVIHNITNTGTNSAAGIMVAAATSGTTLIANNMISGVTANGTASDLCVGILLGGGAGSVTNVYYNTVAMNGTIQGATAGTTQSFALAVTNATAPVLDIRNNILVNTQIPNAGGTTKFYAVGLHYSSTLGNYTDLTSDNNDLFSMAGANNFLGITGGLASGTTRATLADWQTETGRDANSLNLVPVFNSTSDIHINIGDNGNAPLNGAAAVLSLTQDIDCDTRNATTPDIGADEFTIVSCAGAEGGNASGSSAFCVSGTPAIMATGYSIGIGSTHQWQSSVDLAFTTPVDISGQTNPATLTTGVVTSTTYYRLKVTCTTGMAEDYSTIVTVTINALPTATISPSGTINLCPPVSSQLLTASTNANTPSYVWKKDNVVIMGASGSTYSATTTGAYTVMITDGSTSCNSTSTATTVVFNTQPPSPIITPDPAMLCTGDPALLLQVTNITPGSGNVSQSSGTISLAIPDNSSTGVSNIQMITGVPAGATVDSVVVILNIAHTFDADVEVTLEAPNGQIINLVADQGSSSDNFTNTRITSNTVAPAFSSGTPPFTGTFRADAAAQGTLICAPAVTTQMFSNLFSTPNGQWTIRAYDDDAAITGTLTNWTVKVSYSSPSLTWMPNGPGNGLYLDAGATMVYNGEDLNQVYALPATTSSYTVTSENAAGCTNTETVEVTVSPTVVANTNDDGAGSLRAIIDCLPSGGTLTFAPALTGQTITLSTGVIIISKNLTISGLGMSNLTVSGGGVANIFHVLPGITLTIEDIGLSNGFAMTNGGAIYNQGILNLEDVLFGNNLPYVLSGMGTVNVSGSVNIE